MKYPGPLVSTQWLSDHLGEDGLVIVDGTVHLPDTGRNAAEEYVAEHIPGALFFDLEKIADPDNPRPRKVPPRELFMDEVGKLGIDPETLVVAYDTPGLYSAARVWWLFKLYGFDNVAILDGGLKSWKLENRPVESGEPLLPATSFHSGETREELLSRWPQVLEASKQGGQIVDARTPGRWAGTEVDRYPGARAGHIPGSMNLCWSDLLDAETRQLHDRSAISARFAEAGLDFDQPVIISCGSGLTACILALGLELCGKQDWSVYDGSWDEWGRNPELPVDVAAD